MSEILRVSNLSLSIHGKSLVHGLDFCIHEGETLGLIGESGSGKTITSLAIARMLPELSIDSGRIEFSGEDITQVNQSRLQAIRGNDLSYIFQEPLSALNPLHKVKQQVSELLLTHKYKGDLAHRVTELLEQTGLSPKDIENRYPHELSGGQRQRVMIAMALANSPKLLIADEPTTALDRNIQRQILNLLQDLQKSTGLTLLLISHDLHLVRNYSDKIVIMQEGYAVESAETEKIFTSAEHSYTKMLLKPLAQKPAKSKTRAGKPLLRVENLNIGYPIRKGIFKGVIGYNRIINNLSFHLHPGETLGLIGPSGSGKSSIALATLRLISSQGKITFCDQRIDGYNRKKMRLLRKDMQIVFQDPFSSLNPRMTLLQIICEGLAIHITKDPEEQRQLAIASLQQVGLQKSMVNRFAHEFSGGQRQRVALARVLVMNPKLVILDEPTSSLDRSNQRQILGLLKELQTENNFAYVFISHDQEAVDSLSHEVIELDMTQKFIPA